MTDRPDLSILIPAFNERESLEELHREICLVYPADGHVSLEIIVIDDGSTDGSLTTLHAIQLRDSRVRIIRFRRNMGKTVALAVGFKKCRAIIIATLDADLQNDPADIPAMVSALSGGSDFVCGWRSKRQDSADKTIPSHVINRAVPLLSDLKIHDINCGLKVFKSEIIPRIHLFGKQHRYIPLKAYYSGFQVTELKVNHRPRKHGHSKYGFLRFPEGLFDLITTLFMGKFDKSPFYLFGGTGLVLFVTGFGILGGLSIGWLFGQWISHRPLFELAILLVTFGFQLISIGLLAEMFINMIHPAPDPPLEEFTLAAEEGDAIQRLSDDHVIDH